VVSLSQICQFKVDGERLGHAVRLLNTESTDYVLCSLNQRMPFFPVREGDGIVRWIFTTRYLESWFRLAMFYQQESQLFDSGKQFITHLLLQHFSQ
jgi:hypothetical protein